MVYILEELQTQPSVVDIAELKSTAVLLTNDGLRRPADDPVHFSQPYSGFDLNASLPGSLPAAGCSSFCFWQIFQRVLRIIL